MDNRPQSAAFENVPHFTLASMHGTNDCRCFYECDERNGEGERLVVELSHCGWAGGDMARRRFKEGRTDHLIEFWWGFSTYVYDQQGNCWGRYNPIEMTYKSAPDSEGNVRVLPVIDYEWHLDATKENALRLFEEAYRRFMTCEPRKVVGEEYFA